MNILRNVQQVDALFSYIPDMVQEGANATSSHQGNSIACKTSLKANPYLKL